MPGVASPPVAEPEPLDGPKVDGTIAVEASTGADPAVAAGVPDDSEPGAVCARSSCAEDSVAGCAAFTASSTALNPMPVGAGEGAGRGAVRTMAAESGASVTSRSSSTAVPTPIGDPRKR